MSSVVVDANVAAALVISLPYSQAASARMTAFVRQEVQVYAPALWAYEVSSTIRKAIAIGGLDPIEASNALERIDSIGVSLVSPDMSLHQDALRWAEAIGQPVAYDAAYLALAERLGANFLTADRRLARTLDSIDVTWHELIA